MQQRKIPTSNHVRTARSAAAWLHYHHCKQAYSVTHVYIHVLWNVRLTCVPRHFGFEACAVRCPYRHKHSTYVPYNLCSPLGRVCIGSYELPTADARAAQPKHGGEETLVRGDVTPPRPKLTELIETIIIAIGLLKTEGVVRRKGSPQQPRGSESPVTAQQLRP